MQDCKSLNSELAGESLASNEQNEGEKTQQEQNLEALYYSIVDIGKKIEGDIDNDIKEMPLQTLKTYKDIIDYEPSLWLAERPENLLHLLSTICNIDLNTTTPDQVILICKIVELIYACKKSRMILPNHFIENLLCYSCTNCKTFISFLSERGPCGSYTFLSNWLKEHGKEPLEFPKGLVKAVFDNSQKICKTYLITGTNTVPTSVITSHLWITLKSDSDMQNKPELAPKNWIFKSLSTEQQNELKDKMFETSMDFRATRNKLIKQCIQIVDKESDSHSDKVNFVPYTSFTEDPSLPKIICMTGRARFYKSKQFSNHYTDSTSHWNPCWN